MDLLAGGHHEDRLVVKAGARRFAIPMRAVREIVPVPRLTRVPLGPASLRGLGNVRGETLAVLSLAELTRTNQLASRAGTEGQLLVLDGALRAGVLVDRIERLERQSSLEQTAETVGNDPISVLDVVDLIVDMIPPAASRRSTSTPLQRTRSEAPVERLDLLRVSVGNQHFAFPLDQVAEVLRFAEEIAVFPGAIASVVGSIVWRDRTLAVMSLAALLGLSPGPTRSRRVVVVCIARQYFGLTVDSVDAVLRVMPDRIDPVPASLLQGESEARIAAIYRPGNSDRLVSILAADKLLNEAQTARLAREIVPRAEPSAAQAANRPHDLIVLSLLFGDQRLVIPLLAISQVLARPTRIAHVPGSPDWLCGLVMMNGAPIPVIDQVLRLTGTPAQGRQQRMLVIETGGMTLGFLVSATQGIENADLTNVSVAPLPAGLADGIFVHALSGSVRDTEGEPGGRPLLLIDPGAMISSIERSMLEHIASGANAEDAWSAC